MLSETLESTEPWRFVAEATVAAKPNSAEAIGGPQPGSVGAHATLHTRIAYHTYLR